MDQLIEQIERSASGSINDEIRTLKEYRQSIAQVIKLILGVTRLQKSLESVLLLKAPAKEIPRDLLIMLGDISARVANLPVTELQKRLERIEETIRDDMHQILGIAQNPSGLNERELQGPVEIASAVELQKLINNFRRRVNTALVLKLHLRQRGVSINESVIPVEPDVIIKKASLLAVEEKKCRTIATEELKGMDCQMEVIVNDETYPAEMRVYAIQMRGQIEKNIEHLSQGRDIEKLPFAIDIIRMGEAEADNPEQLKARHSEPIPVEIKKTEPLKADSAAQNTRPRAKGFMARLRVWLSTPWSVKWSDTE